MISVKKGTYRIAIILGPITLKIIRPFFFVGFLKTFLGLFFLKKTRVTASLKFYRGSIIRGFFGNMTEFFTWLFVKKDFLAPTYFSCGFFNIQKTINGEGVNCKELIDKIIQQIPENRKFVWNAVESHSMWANSGWRKTPTGYVLIDYADTFVNGWPFSEVLMRDKNVLEKILKEI